MDKNLLAACFRLFVTRAAGGLILALLWTVPAWAAELHDPDPVAIPAGMSNENVVKAIKNAMVKQAWALQSEEPGRIVSTYSPNDHVAKIAISYNDKDVRIAYVDSVNLNFKEEQGQREIHRNYNKWVEALAQQIARFDVSGNPADSLKWVRGGRAYPMNPPPQEKFSGFNHFEIEPITMDPPYAGQAANEAAVAKIDEHLQDGLGALFRTWENPSSTAGQRTLRLQPHIQEIKFINGGARFFVGAMAGSSYVTMKVRYIDSANGTVVAEPLFSARSPGREGFMGIADNEMLHEIASMVRDYTAGNYDAAVGGTMGETMH